MRIMKKVCFSLFIVFFACILGFSAEAAPRMAKKRVNLKKGNAYVLRLKGNSQGQEVVWTSSAKKIVTISSQSHNRAVLKAKKKGTATITAQVGGKRLRCKVKVSKNRAIPAKLTLAVGDTFKFSSKKAADWELSNKRGKLRIGKKRKKAVFTARKKGTCRLTIHAGEDTWTCKITVIRRDGATKKDLKEEKAIKESGKRAQEWLLASMAYSVCRIMLDDPAVYPCSFHSMDLDSETMAFMLYQYQNFADDPRIRSEGEYHVAEVSDMEKIMSEIFGEEDHTNAFGLFRVKYAWQEAGEPDLLYMNATADFGDAGVCYFAEPDSVAVDGHMHSLTGRVMTYNSYARSYIHTATYTANYWIWEDGSFQLDSVSVE